MTRPVWVSEASASARAIPKSDSFTWPWRVDQDVRRLHVPVHDAGRVGGGQRVRGLTDQRGGLVGRQGAVVPDQLREGDVLDVLHHQPLLLVLDHEVEDRHHVRMVEPRGEPRLALGALEVRRAGAGGHADPLERDCPAEHLVAPEPHRAHAAATDLPVERVPACDQDRIPSHAAHQTRAGPSCTVGAQQARDGWDPGRRAWESGSQTRWAARTAMGQACPDSTERGRPQRVPRPLPPRRPAVARPDRALDGPRRPARGASGAGACGSTSGFDPTAPSLHMGHLVQVLTARRLQHAGHTPYALVGGATGMIGDPRDSGERTLNSLDTVKDWVERVRRQIEPFLSFEGANAATMVNNYDWTASLSTIDFLRDIGKHFPVNRMLARDVGQEPARGRHQLHRVQLRAAAVHGLPQPLPRPRRHAAVRRLRPVGQPHRRRRADPPRGRRHTCTPSPRRW